MKHTTKPTPNAPKKSKKRMVALRLDDTEMAVVEQMAKAEQRPVSQLARILLLKGIAERHVEKSLARR